jgi:hypothetical protein
LRAVGQYDFFVGPSCVIGKQDGFAPLNSGQSFQSRQVGGEGQSVVTSVNRLYFYL